MKADLHMHTTCSDGLHTPAELTAMAAAAKLDVIAISDHDTMAAYDGTHRLHDGVKIISAIEMSSDCADEDVHILGYHLDPANEELQDYCRDFKERRAVRARKIVEKCTALGYALDLTVVNDILRRGGTVGRPHIAAMLVEKGYFRQFLRSLKGSFPVTARLTFPMIVTISTPALKSFIVPAVCPF